MSRYLTKLSRWSSKCKVCPLVLLSSNLHVLYRLVFSSLCSTSQTDHRASLPNLRSTWVTAPMWRTSAGPMTTPCCCRWAGPTRRWWSGPGSHRVTKRAKLWTARSRTMTPRRTEVTHSKQQENSTQLLLWQGWTCCVKTSLTLYL